MRCRVSKIVGFELKCELIIFNKKMKKISLTNANKGVLLYPNDWHEIKKVSKGYKPSITGSHESSSNGLMVSFSNMENIKNAAAHKIVATKKILNCFLLLIHSTVALEKIGGYLLRMK